MRIKLFYSLVTLFFLTTTEAQIAGEWTWMKGSNIANQAGRFGTKGVSSPLNNPPCLYEAFEWTDLNGNFWLFGGISIINGQANALWKFDPLTTEWTWMHGDSTGDSNGIYGTKGVAAPTNCPGARGYGGLSWVDTSGDLWMFGGEGRDGAGLWGVYLNDLWRYNIASNQWTWMKGGNVWSTMNGVYGTKGVADTLNTPDGRAEFNGSIRDNENNLWLFGGQASNLEPHNDIWKYSVTTNMWTWIAGSSTTSVVSNYGTQNVASPSNDPGGRLSFIKFMDSQNNIYFLGSARDMGSNVIDVWKFNSLTTEWTWLGGDTLINSAGTYNLACDTNSYNIPKAKHEIRAAWQDSCGVFFFGGFAVASNGLNDLWYYNVEDNNFTWVSGTTIANDPGDYGAKGVSSPSNRPPGRGGALPYLDNQKNLWVFGGLAYGTYFNDLWRFKIDTNCVTLCSKSRFKTEPSIITGLGISNDSNANLVFPNPSTNEFVIDCSSTYIAVYDYAGKLIEQHHNVSGSLNFGKEYTKGIYFINSVSNNSSFTQKIIKQ